MPHELYIDPKNNKKYLLCTDNDGAPMNYRKGDNGEIVLYEGVEALPDDWPNFTFPDDLDLIQPESPANSNPDDQTGDGTLSEEPKKKKGRPKKNP